ncbi:hypothetical protein MNBD_GAMMA08-1724 [hydrothermal vent metagenome]|uniref:General secretion pathway GspH domain-containing protein n=1 Tax=hydrothermal vent metagenome TaxID=652676 RepID=A0A3B0XYQ3_9ZZZZ
MLRLINKHKGKTQASKNLGFTLIELLVVVVIISISVGLVVVNISTKTEADLVEEEAVRLQQILRFAHEQSVVRAAEYGVRFFETGYRFMIFDEPTSRWVYLKRDRLLRGRTLPEPIELDLYIEQTPVDLLISPKDDPEIEEKKEEEGQGKSNTGTTNTRIGTPTAGEVILPQIFLLSSSELTPQFEVRIRIPGSDIEKLLEGLPQGEYKLMVDE